MPASSRFEEVGEVLKRFGAEAQTRQEAARRLLAEAAEARDAGRSSDAFRLSDEAKAKLAESEAIRGEALRLMRLAGDSFDPSDEHPSRENHDAAFRDTLWKHAAAGDKGIRGVLELLVLKDAWWSRCD